ncbi:MAG: VWA domain-containing protein [Hyphomicrobiales bacterium]
MNKNKSQLSKILIPLLVCTSFATPSFAGGMIDLKQISNNQIQQKKQVIEVVFVLDTTGSMGGLLEGAKAKIWHIASEIQNAKSDVEVRIGLIAYRDRGDTYITKHFSITSDIHSIYADLLEFQAGGGGDAPESVNQALYEAVKQQDWSRENDTLRTIFLVGDAPPKMNYKDDIKYMQTVKLAKEKDIIINTILAGNSQKTKQVWQEIAQNANGAFSQIAQDGNVQIVSTPYDEQIQELNIQLNSTVILYGNQKEKKSAQKVLDSIVMAKPAASSDMATYNFSREIKSRVISGKGDLLQELEVKNENVAELSNDKLPDNMKSMNVDERKAYINEMQEKRSTIQTKIDDLVKQRITYKDAELKKLSADDQDSFDQNLVTIIREQAASKNIKY